MFDPIQAARSLVTAVEQGRNLLITITGVEPFLVRPVVSSQGAWLTTEYFTILSQPLDGYEKFERMNALLCIALDGGVWTADGRVEPRPESEQKNWPRLDTDVSLGEGRLIAELAFFWSTVLAMRGVEIYLEHGGGDAGTEQAVFALGATFGLSLTSRNPIVDTLLAIEQNALREKAAR